VQTARWNLVQSWRKWKSFLFMQMGKDPISSCKININPEQAANRFAGALLLPAKTARFECGVRRTDINVNDLKMLKHMVDLSMQAWFYRAKDLEMTPPDKADLLLNPAVKPLASAMWI
jgi:Zn-dependent peptidase ImmA (M78 family)